MTDTLPPELEVLVKEIMQVGFDVAMGGDPFKSEEENKKWQEEEYDKLVAEYSNKIAQALSEQRQQIIKQVEEMGILPVTGDPARFNYNEEYYDGYNQALDDVIKLLKDQ